MDVKIAASYYNREVSVFLNGTPGVSRTRNILLRREMPYRLATGA